MSNILRDYSEFSGTIHGVAKKTQKDLDSKGVKSPELTNMVKIGKNLWLSCPYTNKKEIDKWIKEKQELLKIRL